MLTLDLNNFDNILLTDENTGTTICIKMLGFTKLGQPRLGFDAPNHIFINRLDKGQQLGPMEQEKERLNRIRNS